MTLDDILPSTVRQFADSTGGDTLAELVVDANVAIQGIQNFAKREALNAARIRSPRGYLREARLWRDAVAFLTTTNLRKNIAYALMLYDVQAWVLKRTDLEGQARAMLVKGAITTLGGVAEAIPVDATSPPLGRRRKIASRVKHLHNDQALDDSLRDDLLWLWDTRNRQDLYELNAPEFDVYTRDDHPRAEATVAKLIKSCRHVRKRCGGNISLWRNAPWCLRAHICQQHWRNRVNRRRGRFHLLDRPNHATPLP